MENIALEDKHFRLPASELVGMVNDARERQVLVVFSGPIIGE